MSMNPFDILLTAVKWPVAFLALCFLPASVELFVRQVDFLLAQSEWALFGFGAGALFVFAFLRVPLVRFILTFQHEFSHAVFAWASLHRVSNFTVRYRPTIFGELGHVRVHGGDNWLILIAPYFVPFLPVLLLLVIPSFLKDYETQATLAILCFGAVLHLASNWQQSHGRQSDLQKVRFTFALLFLPTANILIYGLLVAITLRGFYGAVRYFETLALIWSIQLEFVLSHPPGEWLSYFETLTL